MLVLLFVLLSVPKVFIYNPRLGFSVVQCSSMFLYLMYLNRFFLYSLLLWMAKSCGGLCSRWFGARDGSCSLWFRSKIQMM